MNLKGISPIIATVVLITLVVVIAGMIYKSGNEFLTQLSPPAECSQVSFDAGIFQETDGTISLELTNNGVKIDSLILEIFSESLGQSDNQQVSILAKPGESVRQSLNFEIPKDSKIKIIPQIKNAKDEISSCTEEFSKVVEVVQVTK